MLTYPEGIFDPETRHATIEAVAREAGLGQIIDNVPTVFDGVLQGLDNLFPTKPDTHSEMDEAQAKYLALLAATGAILGFLVDDLTTRVAALEN